MAVDAVGSAVVEGSRRSAGEAALAGGGAISAAADEVEEACKIRDRKIQPCGQPPSKALKLKGWRNDDPRQVSISGTGFCVYGGEKSQNYRTKILGTNNLLPDDIEPSRGTRRTDEWAGWWRY